MIFTLLGLILLSGFFSGCETAMMSLNRYRLRHLVRKGNKRAEQCMELLARPDRLLGIILIGNTFANILASSVATLLAVQYFGRLGVFVSTVGLTLVVLIFAEAAPKTFAALHPERFAFPVSPILRILLKLFYPLIWLVNIVANTFLRLFNVRVKKHEFEPLSVDELRSVVKEATGRISDNYQKMLLRILDLEEMTVEDVMIPRNEISGIDINQDWDTILQQLRYCKHSHVPIYDEAIDNVKGILNLRHVLSAMQMGTVHKQDLLQMADKVYFVPEGAQLSRQLMNFQEQHLSIGLVVDEYGDIQGLVTLQDLLEEIVGDFEQDFVAIGRRLKKMRDGSVIVDASISVRDLNRSLDWHFPVDGPKTLGGLIVEHLEMIPQYPASCQIEGYRIEILEIKKNIIGAVHIWPNTR